MGKPYNTFSPDTWYPPARLIEMSETMEPEELAEVTGISIEEVMTALAAVGRKSARLGACDRKTGKTITGHTERGLYLKVQILGWVDWFYFRPEGIAAACADQWGGWAEDHLMGAEMMPDLGAQRYDGPANGVRKSRGRRQVVIVMDDDQFEEVRALAEAQGTSTAEQLRNLIEWGLEASQC